MIVYKCDRCGKMVPASECYRAVVLEKSADLCPVCFEEYVKDKAATERQYKKGLKAIAIKYGAITIKEGLNNG